MTFTPTIYTWPAAVVPFGQVFHSGGEASEGLFTIGGVMERSPEPGGRSSMDVAFNYMRDDLTGRQVSWLTSAIKNGRVFSVPIFRSLQVVELTGVGSTADSLGIPWDNDQPWDNGWGWEYEPIIAATVAALKGTLTLTIDLSYFGQVLQIGHVIGPASGGAHIVDDIEYESDLSSIATVTVSPPWRKNIDVAEMISLRPKMFATVENPDSFKSMFEGGKFIRPGNITFTEAIVS